MAHLVGIVLWSELKVRTWSRTFFRKYNGSSIYEEKIYSAIATMLFLPCLA
jgi:thiamine transporter ThiT